MCPIFTKTLVSNFPVSFFLPRHMREIFHPVISKSVLTLEISANFKKRLAKFHAAFSILLN